VSALILLAALLLLCLLVVLLMRAFWGEPEAGRPALEEAARWETHTEVGDGNTTVAVRRVARTRSGPVELGRQVIATIPDGDPEWEAEYHRAMAQARSRVATLEIESD
jgi:hypothetical protein